MLEWGGEVAGRFDSTGVQDAEINSRASEIGPHPLFLVWMDFRGAGCHAQVCGTQNCSSHN